MSRLLVVLLVCLLAAPLLAQTPVNPSLIEWDCPDHAIDTDHEVGFFLLGATEPVSMQRLGDPAPQPNGKVQTGINSRPLGMGQYELAIRVYVGPAVSEWGRGGPNGDVPVPFTRALSRVVNLSILR